MAVLSWLAGDSARVMNFHAAALLVHAWVMEKAHPPRVVAEPGACPFSVGIGAMPTSLAAAGHAAPEPGSQSPVYQLEPSEMASLPSSMSCGGLPTEFAGKSSDVGAPRPSLKTV